MELAYRIEHSEHRTGPYNPPRSLDTQEHPLWVFAERLREMHLDDRERPTAHDDMGRAFTEDYLCAFASEDQLLDWFGDVIDTLAALGYIIAVYEVYSECPGDVIYGTRQIGIYSDGAGFIRDEALPALAA